MRIGLHVSIAGGLDQAVARAADRGCETMQIFAGNPRNWFDWAVSDEEATAFAEARRAADIRPLVVHAPYLVNAASDKVEVRNRSILSTVQTVLAADLCDADAFVVHAGSSGGASRRDALDRLAAFVHLVLEGAEPKLKFLLENTASVEWQIGSSFEELARVVKLVGGPESLGVCLDTCHAFAAGYDLTTPESVESVLDEFDDLIGLERLAVMHANDSKHPLSSKRDRHEHLGEGFIGLDGFRAIVNNPRLEGVSLILETPGDETDDIRNVETAKSLRYQR